MTKKKSLILRIFTLTSRAHFSDRYSYLIAIRRDLTVKWARSLRGRHHVFCIMKAPDLLNDGCGVTIPDGRIDSCPSWSRGIHKFNSKVFTLVGVDPYTNNKPAGRVLDESSSSPVVLPGN